MLHKRTSKALLSLILLLVLAIPAGIVSASGRNIASAQSAFVKYGPGNGSSVQSTGTVTIVWGSSSGATSYDYCYDTVNNASCDNGWYWTTNTMATINVTVGTTYYWQVRANGSSGTVYANSGTWWSFTPVAAPPPTATPVPFTKSTPANGATGQSPTLITAWSSSPNAVRYEYCYDTSNNNNCDNPNGWVNNGTTQWVYYYNLALNTTYYWQVRAVDANNNIAYPNSYTWWSFTVMPPTATPTKTFTPTISPAFVKYGPGNGSTVSSSTIVWGSSSGASYYEYCIDTNNNNSCDTNWNYVGTSTIANLSLSLNVWYYWQVRATNGSGVITYANGSPTSWWSFRVVATPTPTPTTAPFGKSNPANGGTWHPGTSPLAWNSISGATQYQYCLDTINNGACDTSWVPTGTNTYVFLSGQTIGITYSWQVRAVVGGNYVYANSGSWWTFLTN